MKNRFLALTLGFMLSASAILAGCAGINATTSGSSASSAAPVSAAATGEAGAGEDAASYTDTTVYGTVTGVNGSTVTLSLGTTEDGSRELTLTGETLTVEVPDDATVSRGRGGAGAPGGQPPEMPEGEMPQTPDGQPPEMPEGEMPQASNGQPPEMPEGEMPQASNGQPPEMPSGDAPNGQPPEMPQGSGDTREEESLSVADISEGDTVAVTFDENGTVTAVEIRGGGPGGQMPGGSGGPGSGDSSNIDYTAVNNYTNDTTVTGETIESAGTDENAVLVSEGATVTLDGVTVTRNSSTSSGGDKASFYGVGAAVLTTDGTMNISNATITTDASGGAGVFSYGDGTTYVKDSTIATSQDASGGIHVAGGGTLYAEDLTVTTNGGSSAAIRSDRGSGTMVVEGGSYTSSGSGSPAIYSTADITVEDAELTATASEAICIEGKNSIRLTDCDLTGNMPDDRQNDCTWNVILYQSMSGDSEVGNSTFEMTGGTLTAKNGGMFYTTNTQSTITLEDVDITYAEENDFFLKVTGNSNARGWGKSGSNGADCVFTAIDQEMEGDVIWDSISTLDFRVTKDSSFTGAVINDESNAGSGGDGTATVTIDETSVWVVTGDSELTTLNCAGRVVDANGKTVTIKGTDGTVYVQGDGNCTVTVSNYSADAV